MAIYDAIAAVPVPELRSALRTLVNRHEITIPQAICGTRPGSWISTATRQDVAMVLEALDDGGRALDGILALLAPPTPVAPVETIRPVELAPEGSLVYTETGDGLDDLIRPLFSPFPSPQVPNREHNKRHIHDRAFVARVAAEWRVNGRREGRKPIVMIGQPGSGKSAGLEALAYRANRPLYRVSLGLGTRQDDLIGRWTLINGSTIWQDGVLTRAMREGAWILLDELDSAQDGILASLYEALEPGGCLTLKERDGERVAPANGFWLFATANSLGTDELGLMSHSRACSPALLSRFLAYRVPPMDPDTEGRILVKAWGVEIQDAARIAGAAHVIRELSKNGRLMRLTWGVRESVDLALMRGAGLSWEEAFRAVYADKTTDTEAAEAWEAAKRFLAEGVEMDVSQDGVAAGAVAS